MNVQELLSAFDLFRDPLLAGAIAGLALGLLGIFIVLRRMVFLSAALAQSAGLGVAAAFWVEIVAGFHVSPVLGAGLLTVATGMILFVDTERLKVTREALLALVYIGAGALAVIAGSRIAQEAHDIHGILFGTGVLVRPSDLQALAAGAAVTLLLALLFWRGLVFTSFDSESARVQGLPVRLLQGMLFGLIILMDAVATRALGMLPVFAFSTLPAVGALGITRMLPLAALLAALFGAVAGFGGYLAAFFWDLPVGAAQTRVAAAFAVLGLTIRSLR